MASTSSSPAVPVDGSSEGGRDGVGTGLGLALSFEVPHTPRPARPRSRKGKERQYDAPPGITTSDDFEDDDDVLFPDELSMDPLDRLIRSTSDVLSTSRAILSSTRSTREHFARFFALEDSLASAVSVEARLRREVDASEELEGELERLRVGVEEYATGTRRRTEATETKTDPREFLRGGTAKKKEQRLQTMYVNAGDAESLFASMAGARQVTTSGATGGALGEVEEEKRGGEEKVVVLEPALPISPPSVAISTGWTTSSRDALAGVLGSLNASPKPPFDKDAVPIRRRESATTLLSSFVAAGPAPPPSPPRNQTTPTTSTPASSSPDRRRHSTSTINSISTSTSQTGSPRSSLLSPPMGHRGFSPILEGGAGAEDGEGDGDLTPATSRASSPCPPSPLSGTRDESPVERRRRTHYSSRSLGGAPGMSFGGKAPTTLSSLSGTRMGSEATIQADPRVEMGSGIGLGRPTAGPASLSLTPSANTPSLPLATPSPTTSSIVSPSRPSHRRNPSTQHTISHSPSTASFDARIQASGRTSSLSGHGRKESGVKESLLEAMKRERDGGGAVTASKEGEGASWWSGWV
ncbi:hypothetical protein MNV49_001134 [Pseudohyphozyma bogoriensis]|nr:hypothetical protein MNV49_001134 [Pseudohyphozyma bogoriensis]